MRLGSTKYIDLYGILRQTFDNVYLVWWNATEVY